MYFGVGGAADGQRAEAAAEGVEKGKKTPSNDILNKLSEGFNLDIEDLLLLDEYHNSLIGKKEKLEIYRMLLLKTLETYEEKEVKKCK